ncbi:MAG TPA: hypothetical protein DEQ38_14410 [Elusimicrobia bacterium]|nr:MAG: hypothetical protein A2089_06875 [Elusimicrobia bacterium GWD2_63_28]HCC49287.1 hypothetical protein [Elusimicrobiota bacterium]
MKRYANLVLRALRRTALCLPALALLAAGVRAQTIPLEDKAKFEKSLEQKAEDVLMKLLGPGQAKVVVQASMDFTRTEKLDVSADQAPAGDDKNKFQWKDLNPETQAVADYVMPGFPIFSAAQSENRSYQRSFMFPTSFVKRMSVTIVLNKDLTDAEVQNARSVISDVLRLDQVRGDELTVVKAPFAPLWKTIWYTPEAVNLVFKYGVLSLMGIIAMIVVAIGFLKLAGAMNTMAKAQQSHQITMDLGKGAAGAPGAAPGAPALPGGLPQLSFGGPESAERPEAEEAPSSGDEVVFAVRAEQVPFLVQLIGREDPNNVALVVSHLRPEVRGEFLRALPPDVMTEVMGSMSRVRFVEADTVTAIKDELERRLAGAEGGAGKLLEILNTMDLRSKRGMLEGLRLSNPSVAAELRAKILLLEDLGSLADRELSLVVSAVKTEDWAAAFHEMPDDLKAKISAQMADKTRAMLEQSMKYGKPSREKIDRVQEDIVGVALKLVREGRISNPLENAQALLSGGEAPAGQQPLAEV